MTAGHAFPGDARYAAIRSAARDRERQAQLTTMADAELACLLLVHLWKLYDSTGMSYGRSTEAKLLEPAQALLSLPRPEDNWPVETLIREAKRRVGDRPRLVKGGKETTD